MKILKHLSYSARSIDDYAYLFSVQKYLQKIITQSQGWYNNVMGNDRIKKESRFSLVQGF